MILARNNCRLMGEKQELHSKSSGAGEWWEMSRIPAPSQLSPVNTAERQCVGGIGEISRCKKQKALFKQGIPKRRGWQSCLQPQRGAMELRGALQPGICFLWFSRYPFPAGGSMPVQHGNCGGCKGTTHTGCSERHRRQTDGRLQAAAQHYPSVLGL